VQRRPNAGEVVTILSALAMLVGSFLPFVQVQAPKLNFTVWSNSFGILPLMPALVFATVGIGVVVTMRTFTKARFPDRVLGLGWDQAQFAVAVIVAVTTLCYLARDPGAIIRTTGIEHGTGVYVILASAVGLGIGALLMMRRPRRQTRGPWA
jgi:hypothetical protein